MRRSEAELRQSLLRPDDLVASAYWSVVAKDAAGQVARGIRLNEDTHSVQIREERGTLRSLAKKHMTSIELVRRSPMPSFEGKLSTKDLDDVLAFLARPIGDGR
jgi:mono/diheme cytochrome c family protein